MTIQLDARIPGGPLEKKWDRRKFEMKLVNPANKRKYTVIMVGSGLAGAGGAASMAELGYPKLVASTFTAGASEGMTIVAEMPNRLAAIATPCA